MLEDFGVPVRFTTTLGEVETTGLYDGPTENVSGVASELEFLEPSSSLFVQTSAVIIASLSLEDPVEVLQGGGVGSYTVRSIVREDDGELSRLELAEA